MSFFLPRCTPLLCVFACSRPLQPLPPLTAQSEVKLVPETAIAGVTPLRIEGDFAGGSVVATVREADLRFDTTETTQVLPADTPAGLADVSVRAADGRVTRQTLLVLQKPPALLSVRTESGREEGVVGDRVFLQGSGFDARATTANVVTFFGDGSPLTGEVLSAAESTLLVRLPDGLRASGDSSGELGGRVEVGVTPASLTDAASNRLPFLLLGSASLVTTVPARPYPGESTFFFFTQAPDALLGWQALAKSGVADPKIFVDDAVRRLDSADLAIDVSGVPTDEVRLVPASLFPQRPAGAQTVIQARLSRATPPGTGALRVQNSRRSTTTTLQVRQGGDLLTARALPLESARTADDFIDASIDGYAFNAFQVDRLSGRARVVDDSQEQPSHVYSQSIPSSVFAAADSTQTIFVEYVHYLGYAPERLGREVFRVGNPKPLVSIPARGNATLLRTPAGRMAYAAAAFDATPPSVELYELDTGALVSTQPLPAATGYVSFSTGVEELIPPFVFEDVGALAGVSKNYVAFGHLVSNVGVSVSFLQVQDNGSTMSLGAPTDLTLDAPGGFNIEFRTLRAERPYRDDAGFVGGSSTSNNSVFAAHISFAGATPVVTSAAFPNFFGDPSGARLGPMLIATEPASSASDRPAGLRVAQVISFLSTTRMMFSAQPTLAALAGATGLTTNTVLFDTYVTGDNNFFLSPIRTGYYTGAPNNLLAFVRRDRTDTPILMYSFPRTSTTAIDEHLLYVPSDHYVEPGRGNGLVLRGDESLSVYTFDTPPTNGSTGSYTPFEQKCPRATAEGDLLIAQQDDGGVGLLAHPGTGNAWSVETFRLDAQTQNTAFSTRLDGMPTLPAATASRRLLSTPDGGIWIAAEQAVTRLAASTSEISDVSTRALGSLGSTGTIDAAVAAGDGIVLLVRRCEGTTFAYELLAVRAVDGVPTVQDQLSLPAVSLTCVAPTGSTSTQAGYEANLTSFLAASEVDILVDVPESVVVDDTSEPGTRAFFLDRHLELRVARRMEGSGVFHSIADSWLRPNARALSGDTCQSNVIGVTASGTAFFVREHRGTRQGAIDPSCGIGSSVLRSIARQNTAPYAFSPDAAVISTLPSSNGLVAVDVILSGLPPLFGSRPGSHSLLSGALGTTPVPYLYGGDDALHTLRGPIEVGEPIKRIAPFLGGGALLMRSQSRVWMVR